MQKRKKAFTYIYKEASKNKKYLSPVRAHGNVPYARNVFSIYILLLPDAFPKNAPCEKAKKRSPIYKEASKNKKYLSPVRAHGHVAHARNVFSIDILLLPDAFLENAPCEKAKKRLPIYIRRESK
ncbi:hypothetical protein [Myroides odoratus]|uniref:hypothetical protein n=1 Tax=Myroides odoratus TaxID=256 RepID=UPI00333FF099